MITPVETSGSGSFTNGVELMITRKWSAAVVGACIGLVSAVSLVSPAQATGSQASTVSAGQSRTIAYDGGVTTTMTLGLPARVSVNEVEADPGLTAGQKQEIESAAAISADALSSNHWSQFTNGGSYQQTQNGTFYYNGSRVWISQSYAGRQGSHLCFSNYHITPIENITVGENGGITFRRLSCDWDVVQPIGITTHASMTATVSKDGRISGFGATVG
ncbi:hypothetical protein [Clavibacter michiganensis]|uniref:hypothetical protein n=1 Tax=Clavibacter michiganensis TaxID=28447 RepID=UPI0026DD2C45|nr:hypothetical protein [Clavibacter michiganensis]MDO4066327.1 hypothetical protein [Clavibacter michiganensis]MDO4072541.1 hypothetical protein [Clavibacter michiganensis]MDO4090704.1 hypothetical protein [Clavibacter michiganensis]